MPGSQASVTGIRIVLIFKKMIYHVYKTDCYRASRVIMQANWDCRSKFIHRSNVIDEHNIRLNLINTWRVIRSLRCGDAVVFHAQSSLPYLLLGYLFVKFYRKKIVMVYDIHDLHEWFASAANLSPRAIARYIVLRQMEALAFNFPSIRKITVSEGLANIMSTKYKSPKPYVVRNISHVTNLSLTSSRLNQSIVYFGLKRHAPVQAYKLLDRSDISLHLYGRGMEKDWISRNFQSADESVHSYGEYVPDDLSFLASYKVLLLFPDAETTNYKYALPNKLFQAIDYGLIVIISDHFSEILQIFSNAPESIRLATCDNLNDVVQQALKEWTPTLGMNAKIIKDKLLAESRESYLKCTTTEQGGGNMFRFSTRE